MNIPFKTSARFINAAVRLQTMQDKVTAKAEAELSRLNAHMSAHLNGNVLYEVDYDYDGVMLVTVYLDNEDITDLPINSDEYSSEEVEAIMSLYTTLAAHLPRESV